MKYLQKAVTRLNSEKTQMLGMTPAKAVKLGTIELKVKPYPEQKVLPEDGLYRYLYNPGELEDDNRRRATDCLLYTSPSPRDKRQSRMPSSA